MSFRAHRSPVTLVPNSLSPTTDLVVDVYPSGVAPTGVPIATATFTAVRGAPLLLVLIDAPAGTAGGPTIVATSMQ
ncbi:MAG: hypothetical protein HY275_14795 [Gemmatimonadetes bacterium]|nr:hypothetical protein [Gemmatimonadota bacterium]